MLRVFLCNVCFVCKGKKKTIKITIVCKNNGCPRLAAKIPQLSAIGCDWLQNAHTQFRESAPPGSEGKCRRFAAKWFTFPGEKRRNGGKINIFGGKVHQKSGKMVHFPPAE